MYVSRLEINDLRSIKAAALELLHPGKRLPRGKYLHPNVNVLLGNNGAGKTSVLRAIALAVLAPVFARSSGYVPYRLVRVAAKGKQPELARARVELILDRQDVAAKRRAPPPDQLASGVAVRRRGDSEWVEDQRDAKTEHLWDPIFEKDSPAFFLVGYGATRRVDSNDRVDPSVRDKDRHPRYQRVAGLFEEHVSLIPLTAWLPQFARRNPGRFKQVVNLMNRLLPDGCKFLPEVASKRHQPPEYVFQLGGVAVPFRALSDGYRAYIGWIGDMLYHICMTCPSNTKLVDNRGVVLIDEVDLHLHPEWQRTVVTRLANVLRNIQFVMTTHSPIVIGTLQSANILVLQAARGVTTVERSGESVHGLSADQILMSPYFGLSSTRAPEAEDELERLARATRQDKPDAAIAYLRRLSGKTAA